jgi:alkanesulfonate monooxygenase SsuD/methylene tetrahydromethanopterin reductase-like flavin-dependent oxidoreductase (luciferase family)
MEFGIFVHSKPQNFVADTKLAEERGFTHAWFADVPMSMGDVFVAMGLAAAATQRIKIGAGIAVTSNRSAAVTANAIATVNALAPGRVILGYGSGSFTRASQGLPALKVAEVRKHLTVVRDLLAEGAAIDESEGTGRKIRFFNRGHELTALTPRVPIYVAASAPRMGSLAGELGDGLFSGTHTAEVANQLLGHVRKGAAKANREISKSFPFVVEVPICVLREGEALDSPRVIDRTGWWVMMILKFFFSTGMTPPMVPSGLRSSFEAYQEVPNPVPRDELHLAAYEGAHTLLPAERRFITADAIRATTLVGTGKEVIDRISQLAEAGITQLGVSTGLDTFRETADEISRELIGRV